jgi:uncharacterized membrane protein YqjE
MQAGDDASRLGPTVQEITERAQVLVREEIELAKAELQVKVAKLARAAAVGAAAGIFAVAGLLFLLHTLAWGLAEIFGFHPWLGYGVTAVILFVLAAVAGLLAKRWLDQGSPPKPELAIEEAQRIRQTVQDSRS